MPSPLHRPVRARAPGRVAVWRTAITAALVGAVGFAVAYGATDGFEAYTLESARRLSALRSPKPVPELALELADGGRTRLSAMPARVLLVDFIYTSCPTQCVALGSIYATLQQRLAAEIAAGEVRLVSISFDAERDSPGELRAYRARHTRDATGWALGRPVSASELRSALEAFGVVVIPDGMGGYAHNAAAHVVGSDGRLAAILDPTDIDGIVRMARKTVARTAGHVAAR